MFDEIKYRLSWIKFKLIEWIFHKFLYRLLWKLPDQFLLFRWWVILYNGVYLLRIEWVEEPFKGYSESGGWYNIEILYLGIQTNRHKSGRWFGKVDGNLAGWMSETELLDGLGD